MCGVSLSLPGRLCILAAVRRWASPGGRKAPGQCHRVEGDRRAIDLAIGLDRLQIDDSASIVRFVATEIVGGVEQGAAAEDQQCGRGKDRANHRTIVARDSRRQGRALDRLSVTRVYSSHGCKDAVFACWNDPGGGPGLLRKPA